jgi:hypothetical protein
MLDIRDGSTGLNSLINLLVIATMASRQGSISSFFKKPAAEIESKPKVKSEPALDNKREKSDGRGIIDLTDDTVDNEVLDTPRKRRKLSPLVEVKPKTEVSGTIANQELLKIDTNEPFTYPPSSHPSYPPPPSRTHNHPFPIPPPPESLLSALRFNPNPKPILKPDLNLDLLYFHKFINEGSKELYDYLLDSMPWYRVTYITKGFTVNTPRWTTVFGKDLQSKDWSGYPAGVRPRAIPEILLRLMEIGMSPSLPLILLPMSQK